MAAPHASETFLDMFGTPTLLWRVLSSMGYEEPPQYTWTEAEHAGSLPWVDVQITVPPCPNNPQWLGWIVECDGQTPWEGAQVAALEVLLEIC
jgi:hypothetical protein